MNKKDAGREPESVAAALDALAARRGKGPQRDLFRQFLRHYYEMASQDTVRLRTPEELVDIAWSHFSLAAKRKSGETLICAKPPAGSRGFAVVQSAVDDMPFLYDSISMLVRESGVSVDWSVHPVLRVQRDGRGALKRVYGSEGTSAEGQSESLIHLECEPLPDPAAYERLESGIRRLVEELRTVVSDYPAMREKLNATLAELETVPVGARAEEFAEARAFLKWLDDAHFTFLGYSEATVESEREHSEVHNIAEAGLGLLRAGARFSDTDEIIAPREELSKYATSPRVIVTTKANTRSPIHHPEYLDVISVKHFREDGSVEGMRRFIGLYSTIAYTNRPNTIPLIRRKAEYVMQRSRLPEKSHSGKHLQEILHSLPRDELFQSSEEEIYQVCMGIRALRDRHQLRLFMRRDRYGRFYSCMVYLPRDRYSRELRDRIAQELVELFGGTGVDRNVDFLRDGLARIHYIVRTPPGTRSVLAAAQVEDRLIAVTRSWRDQLREALLKLPAEQGAALAGRWLDAFPVAYTSVTSPAEAAIDVPLLQELSEARPILLRLVVDADTTGSVCPTALKLYSWKHPIALSGVLPTLENFGLHVVRQDPTEVRPRDSEAVWIQQFEIRIAGECSLPADQQRSYFESAFLKTWHGDAENDGLNRLVLLAGLDHRQVTCLRAVCKYLIQTGLPYSQPYMEQLLSEHAAIARLLVQLFEARFDPSREDGKRRNDEARIAQELDPLLDQVATLDGDRVLRAFLGVINATLRTSYFQRAADGTPKVYVSLKLDPRKVPELPLPLPMFEIFVYSPDVEGIHLRGGKVARGGLRWSDRKQDFRTEVLGLMKAQMVKNAIIVPVGAKGGFVVKRGDPSNREQWLKQGVECYKTFLRGLLDLTDNRIRDDIVPPKDVVRYDEDDPYLVVAADKGTATFSDIANAVAGEYGFWLGDAFASGGSAGYDHKKMGITARGAWESVKRHFREVGKDIQNETFTVAGVGDMSGDVFGNGMLLSRRIRLVAAFDHRHIFLDPEPDPERSFVERERMFRLPRSSWADYDTSLISKGGGVYPRSAKSIRLSDEAKAALDVRKGTMTPNELMNAILKAPVELLWNGGIGTYVKSREESHQECGDRANDAIRVNGRELRCKVVGEGGNLGCTQLGRIEFALAGGKINTDFIDNAGGVHSSDREVNIKIPLNGLMQDGALDRKKRDPLLAKMEQDVVKEVLHDNYVQSLAISLIERDAPNRLDEHANLIRTLERDGLLARSVEYLPDDESLNERRSRGRGLTRPELSVLVSYSKISLFDAVLNSPVADDPFFTRDLLAYFPPLLVKQYGDVLARHRLRREIIATTLSNAVVNRMGFAFVHRFSEDHGLPREEVVKAYAMAHEIYGGDRYWLPIQELDNRIPAALQLRLYGRAIGLMKHVTTWLLNYRWADKPIGEAVDTFREGISALTGLLPDILPPSYRADWDKAVAGMERDGTPHELAMRLANTMVLGSAPDIVEIARRAEVSLREAAGVYFQIGDRLRVLWLLSSIIGLQVQGKWQALARHNLREDTYRLHRLVASRILEQSGKSPEERIDTWIASSEAKVKFGIQRLQTLQAAGVSDFMTLAVGVRELRKLRQL